MTGHKLRHEGLIALVIEGIAVGRIGQSRPNLKYKEQVIKDVGASSYEKTNRMAQDAIKLRRLTPLVQTDP